MEPIIRNRYNERILAEARQRYGIAEDRIKLLDGFESFMFEFEKEGGHFILRLSHSRRRSPDMIRGEVDWINYLSEGGAKVARAVLSEQDELVELIDDNHGGHFLATAFVKAEGGPVWNTKFWKKPFFIEYGRLLGRIHSLSKNYKLPNPAWSRGVWNDETTRGLPETDDSPVTSRYNELMRHLESLPREKESFGMIHQDAHAGNFFVDEKGRITLFDFDDCITGHFVYDLAMVLFYVVTNRDDAEELGRTFWPPFWQGYCEENRLDSAWLKEIPHFMKLREIDLYTILTEDLTPEEHNEWMSAFLKNRLERIEKDIPYLSMKF